jgi:hypothetical protein
MKAYAVAVAILFLGLLCSAQDSTEQSSVAAAAQASRSRVQDAQTKQADIRQLLAITGAANLAVQSMDEVEKSMRPLMTNALPPGEYRERLVDLFFEKFHAKRDPQQLVDLIIPVYDKYYSDEEIKQLTDFYQTPLGKKMLSVLPRILAESQAAGRTWGEQMGRQCMIEVLSEHPDLQKAIEQAKANLPSH